MSLVRLVARPLLAAGFVYGGVTGLRNAPQLGGKAHPVTERVVPLANKALPAQANLPTDPETLVKINAISQIVAGAALATGRFPRLSAIVLASSVVPTTVAGHPFWKEGDPAAARTQKLQFAKNASMLGGVLLAAVDTEGQPGVAWRARRAAKDLKRETKRARKDAVREGRLVAAKVR